MILLFQEKASLQFTLCAILLSVDQGQVGWILVVKSEKSRTSQCQILLFREETIAAEYTCPPPRPLLCPSDDLWRRIGVRR